MKRGVSAFAKRVSFSRELVILVCKQHNYSGETGASTL
jgi:hypothetical protein